MKRYLISAMAMFCSISTFAQLNWGFGQVIYRLPKIRYDQMQYDYKVTLENTKTGAHVDSMYGHLVISRNKFIDSNKLFFIAKNGTQYCKLDHIDKTAKIFNLKDLEIKLRLPIFDEQSNGIVITEQLMNTQGENIVWDISNPMFYRVSFTFRDQNVRAAQLDFKRADSSLIGALFQVDDDADEGDGGHFRRTYQVFNINPVVNESVFDFSRIFQMRRGQAVVNKKYAHYKLIKVI